MTLLASSSNTGRRGHCRTFAWPLDVRSKRVDSRATLQRRWRSVIFDLDGTLVNSIDAAGLTIKNFLAIFAIEAPPKDEIIKSVCKLTQEQSVNFYLPKDLKGNPDYLSFALKYLRWVHQRFREKYCHAYDGIPNCLKELSARGIRLAILTRNSTETVKQFIHKYSLQGIIEEYMSADDGVQKSEAIKQLIVKLQSTARQCVFVSDTSYDIEEGKSAGVDTIGITWGVHNRAQLKLARPTWVIETLSELMDLLEQ